MFHFSFIHSSFGWVFWPLVWISLWKCFGLDMWIEWGRSQRTIRWGDSDISQVDADYDMVPVSTCRFWGRQLSKETMTLANISDYTWLSGGKAQQRNNYWYFSPRECCLFRSHPEAILFSPSPYVPCFFQAAVSLELRWAHVDRWVCVWSLKRTSGSTEVLHLMLSASLLIFMTNYCEASSWLESLVWVWDPSLLRGYSTAKISLPNFNCHMSVWDQPVSCLYPSYKSWYSFYVSLVLRVLFR